MGRTILRSAKKDDSLGALLALLTVSVTLSCGDDGSNGPSGGAAGSKPKAETFDARAAKRATPAETAKA